MVSKSTDKARKVKENGEGKEQKRGRIRKLELKRETIQGLSKKEQRGVKGALARVQGENSIAVTSICTYHSGVCLSMP